MGVARIEPATLGMTDPLPSRPEDADGQRFHVAGWDVNQQGTDVPVGDGLQMVADGVEMPVGDEARGGFKDWPRLADKGVQDLLRFEWL